MAIKANEITRIIKEQIKDYGTDVVVSEVGTVISAGDGIARIHGLEKVMSLELLEFPHDVYGMAFNLEESNVGAVLFGAFHAIKEGDLVKRTKRIMEVPKVQQIKRNDLDPLQVEEAAVRFLLGQPGIEAVLTRTQLETGQLPKSRLGQQVASSWDSTRSGDLVVIQKNRWHLMGDPDALAAPHGSPYSYDTHVPLLFLGPWFKSGRYPLRVEIVDLAATLARLLKLELSSQAEGRVLIESLK